MLISSLNLILPHSTSFYLILVPCLVQWQHEGLSECEHTLVRHTCLLNAHRLSIYHHIKIKFLFANTTLVRKLQYHKQNTITISLKVIHVHHIKMFITLVWNVQQPFYLHHFHIIIFPILFCVHQFQSITSLLSYSIIIYY